MTTKEQAEAMAREIYAEAVNPFGNTPDEKIAKFSTAFEKLLTENERSKAPREGLNFPKFTNYCGSYEQFVAAWEEDIISLQSQLTATEKRLKDAKVLIHNASFLARHSTNCQLEKAQRDGGKCVCDCGLDKLHERIRAFLSTLTAEKKEQG